MVNDNNEPYLKRHHKMKNNAVSRRTLVLLSMEACNEYLFMPKPINYVI